MTLDTPVRIAYREGADQVVHFSVPEYAHSFARMMRLKHEVESIQIGSERIERLR
jgi:hypothetical protein